MEFELEFKGSRAKDLYERYMKHIALGATIMSRGYPLVLDSAKGAIMKDVDGYEYIDFLSTNLCCILGHCHPKVVKAVKEQIEKLDYTYEIPHPTRVKLLEKIAEIAPGELKEGKIVLSCSGSEVNEIARKIAIAYTGKFEIMSFFESYHGKLGALLGVTTFPSSVWNFGPRMPLVNVPYPYCYRCPFKMSYPECGLYCIDFIEKMIYSASAGSIAAAILEPIRGAMGCTTPPEDWFSKFKRLCDKFGILLIADEVQCAPARTGKMFGCEHFGVIPDIITLSKNITSGLPISVLIGKRDIVDSKIMRERAGMISSTMTGSPIPCAAALATLETIIEEKLDERAAKLGEYVRKRLEEMQEKYDIIGCLHGRGFLQSIELVKDRKSKEPAAEEAWQIIMEALKMGLYIGGSSYHAPPGTDLKVPQFIKIAPPLNIPKELLDKGLDILDRAISKVVKGRSN